MSLQNPYPEQKETHERQGGGNKSVTGETHDSTKAKKIPHDRRYPGADQPSPDRVKE